MVPTAQPQPVRKRKVVIFGSYAPSLIAFRGPLIAAMVERGHEVHALAPDMSEDVSRGIEALGARPVQVRLGRTSLDPAEAFRSRRELGALFARLRPDIVIAYTIKPILLGAGAARTAGAARFVPIITGLGYAFLGGVRPKRLLIRLAAMLGYRRALRHAAVVLFQNPDDRDHFRRLGLVPGTVPVGLINGSGVDLEHYAPKPLPPGMSFLMISRFLRDKGVREFGQAAGRLKKEFPHVEVRLAGWRDMSPDAIGAEELDAMAADGIERVGYLKDVRPALEACSVYVLPSYREGTPRSVLEAMAVGRAIVTTDAPGCRETVEEGRNGFMVPVADADALYRAMRRFVEHPELCARMAAESRRIAEEKYDVRRVNQAILDHAGL